MIETLFEDDDIIVVHKPAGVASQNTASNETSLLDALGKELLPVHRLDQRVSGIILLAKNKEDNTQLIKFIDGLPNG